MSVSAHRRTYVLAQECDQLTPEDMIRRVCEYRGVPITTLRSRRRWANVAEARHEAIWLLREATEMSFPVIARAVGMRNHTSALSAHRKIASRADHNAVYREQLLSLVRPVRVERLACANVSCSGCIPERADLRVAA